MTDQQRGGETNYATSVEFGNLYYFDIKKHASKRRYSQLWVRSPPLLSLLPCTFLAAEGGVWAGGDELMKCTVVTAVESQQLKGLAHSICRSCLKMLHKEWPKNTVQTILTAASMEIQTWNNPINQCRKIEIYTCENVHKT